MKNGVPPFVSERSRMSGNDGNAYGALAQSVIISMCQFTRAADTALPYSARRVG
jgi:hypothetical protein